MTNSSNTKDTQGASATPEETKQPVASKSVPKVKRLNIKLHVATEKEYERAMKEYVGSYTTYQPGGFLSVGRTVNDPITGQAKWNQRFPDGYMDWVNGNGTQLTPKGQQSLIDKINELVKAVTALTDLVSADLEPSTVRKSATKTNPQEMGGKDNG